MELYTRIIAISLQSNEIKIGGPRFSKIIRRGIGHYVVLPEKIGQQGEGLWPKKATILMIYCILILFLRM